MNNRLLALSLTTMVFVFCVCLLIYSVAYAAPGYNYKCHTQGHSRTVCEDIDGTPCSPGDYLCQCHDEFYWTCENGYTRGNTPCTGCSADADI